jgi:hypothetical protein
VSLSPQRIYGFEVGQVQHLAVTLERERGLARAAAREPRNQVLRGRLDTLQPHT